MESRQFENLDFFKLVETELEECGKVHFKVKGFSMQPIIRNGRDSVLLEKYDGRKLNKGDVCLFRFNGRHVLHRYIRDNAEGMVMRGDNVPVNCEYCTEKDVVGVVKTIIHDGKEISPTSLKWRIITLLHRNYIHVRLFGGRLLRKLGLKK